MKSFILLALLALSFSGCATIIHGKYQDVRISSNPVDARVQVDGHYLGQTPLMVSLRRKDNHNVLITLDGYQPYNMTINRKLSGWIVGNVIYGGVLGIAVDAITGSMYILSPSDINADIGGLMVNTKKDDLYIQIVLEPKADWLKIGELTRE